MGNLSVSCQPGEVPQPPTATGGQVQEGEGDGLGHADIIFTGGNIVTMDESKPSVEALAVKGDKIMAVGTKDEILGLKGDSTRVVELTGTQTLMPGFIEPHTHPYLVLSLSIFTDLSGFTYTSFGQVKKAIKKAVKSTKPADPTPWVIFKGWDPALITDLPPLNAKTLDQLATTKYPVFVLSQAMHSAWLNTKGLEVCNITKATKDPPGGKIVRDHDGNPTGMLKEGTAINLATQKIPRPNAIESAKPAFQALRQYSQNGFTTITEMGTISLDLKTLAMLTFLTLMPECPVRLGVYYPPTSKIKPAIEHINKKLWFPGVKIWADGSPYTGSMAIAEPPYLKTPMTEALDFDFDNYPCGYLIYESADVQADTLRPFSGELLATHCHGERAIDQSLDAYEKLIQSNPENSDHRYRLEHVGLITEEQLRRATQLGVTMTIFVSHVYYYGYALQQGILGERAERFAPTSLATTCGQTHWTLHEDSPFFPINPFVSMRNSVTREMWKDPSRGVLGPQFRSTIEEALKAYTINAAWQLKREGDLGSLTAGKLADLVVLDNNPLVVSPANLANIKVLGTYLGGELVQK